MSGKGSTCFCGPQKEPQGNESLVLPHSCLHSSHNAPDDGQHWQPSLGTHPGYHKIGWHSKGSIPSKQDSCMEYQRVWRFDSCMRCSSRFAECLHSSWKAL